MKKVTAIAPATVANVSCGFDIFGFAVDAPFDEVEVWRTPELVIEEITGDNGRLSKDPLSNTCGVAVSELLKALNANHGVGIRLRKNLALGSGMGSSAASAVAALVAVNHLLNEPFTKHEMLPFAMEAERVACGSAHADNVAPSLLGGFVLIKGYDPLDVVNIPTPPNLYCTLIHPHVEVKTSDARKVLRSTLPLRDAITQWGNIAGLVAGLMKPDYGLIGRSLKDVVAEPVRSLLIPGFDHIRQMALDEGALGAGISGSGPTIFALCTERDIAVRVAKRVQSEFKKMELSSDTFVSRINGNGARVTSTI